MSNIKELFIVTINEGIKAAGMIPDAAAKANAYANLANALAKTGLVRVDGVLEEETATGKEALKPETSKGKTASKKKAAPKAKPEVEEVEQEEAPITKEEKQQVEQAIEEASVSEQAEDELEDEWTEEMLEKLAPEIEYIQNLKETYDEEALDECVRVFSEGHYTSLGDVSPVIIRGFISYMDAMIADADSEEE